jgi:hypothetical protein
MQRHTTAAVETFRNGVIETVAEAVSVAAAQTMGDRRLLDARRDHHN